MADITIYWAPTRFIPDIESYNLIYRDPEPVFDDVFKLVNQDLKDKQMLRCPASNDALRNLYQVKSNIDEKYVIDKGFLDTIENFSAEERQHYIDSLGSHEIPLPMTGNKIGFMRTRSSIFTDYYDIAYNMGWMMFSSEPLLAHFTAPYFPAISPAPGVILTTGIFDIGQWFRPFNLNFLVPKSVDVLEFKENDPLFYVKFMTNKKITFKRFVMTRELSNLSVEFSNASNRYGKRMPLVKRYEMAKRTKTLDIVRKEIEKNLV